MTRQTRRRFLTAVAMGGFAAIAGCTSFTSESSTSTPDAGSGDESTPTDTPTSGTATATATTAADQRTPNDSTTETAGSTQAGGPIRLLPDDGDADDAFGESVAIDGDTALVGASSDEDPNGGGGGSAYVFRRSDSGWAQGAKLAPGDGESGDNFGFSVALSGDTALVGAMGDQENGALGGAAYVFVRSGAEWRLQAKLHPDDGDDADVFGWSVALSGDTALVGAPFDEDPNGAQAGSTYVFTRSSEEWTQEAKLAPEDGESGDSFGVSLAVADDTAIVGAAGATSSNGNEAGSAHVFRRSESEWTRQSTLAPDDGDSDDNFGEAVALSGDTALVGAADDEDPNGDGAGSAYVFRHSDDAWTQEAKLASDNGRPKDDFGRAVALSGTTAVVGAVGRADGSLIGGTAYVFADSEDDGNWSQQAQIDPTGGDGNGFGRAVAASDGRLLVGAGAEENDNGSLAGAAYVFPA